MTKQETDVLEKKIKDSFDDDFKDFITRSDVLFNDIKKKGGFMVSLDSLEILAKFSTALSSYIYDYSDSYAGKMEKLEYLVDLLAELKIKTDELFIFYVLQNGKEVSFTAYERKLIMEMAEGQKEAGK